MKALALVALVGLASCATQRQAWYATAAGGGVAVLGGAIAVSPFVTDWPSDGHTAIEVIYTGVTIAAIGAVVALVSLIGAQTLPQ